jgi:hypothetical protein
VEGNNPEFLRKFIPAIERTIAECADRPDDQEGLRHLKEICEDRLAAASDTLVVVEGNQRQRRKTLR